MKLYCQRKDTTEHYKIPNRCPESTVFRAIEWSQMPFCDNIGATGGHLIDVGSSKR